MSKEKEYTFEEMLSIYGYIVYTCVGRSMMPFLRERKDIIGIQPIIGRAKKYDVILYKRNDTYILHRVLKDLSSGYIVAGDNNTFVERDVTDDMILGVMKYAIRDGKHIYPTSWKYRLYVHLWCDCYPFRMFVLRLKYRIFAIATRAINKIMS